MQLFALITAGQMPTDKKVFIYSRDYDLSSFGFFQKNSVKEVFKFVCRESLVNLEKGSRHSVVHENYMIHILVSDYDNFGFYAFVSADYPRRIAFDCLKKLANAHRMEVGDSWKKMQKDENIKFLTLNKCLKEYAEPKKVDNLLSAQTKVDEIKVIMHENIKLLLERGQKIETLVAKSNDLSSQTKMFMKQTEKTKSCCNIF